MNDETEIRQTIKYMIDSGREKFIIYPFGTMGQKAKRILNEVFGISEYAIVDNKLSKYNPKVSTFDRLFKEGKICEGVTVLLTMKMSPNFLEVSNICYNYFEPKDVFDVFSPSLYHKPYRLLTKMYYYAEDVRFATFESMMREVYRYGVSGSVAECGVARGESAKVIHRLFPDRTTYLFDTFSGFSEVDVEAEKKSVYAPHTFGDFSNTSISLVLSKMINRKMISVHKGWFPETAKDIKDEFCFVHIDMDLHDPCLAALDYFYPRLSRGGYILIHDGRNGNYKGAIESVREFCEKVGIGYVITPDYNGTCIICK